MKTEATRPPESPESSHASMGARAEAAGASFPEVLGQHAMGVMPGMGTGTGTGTGAGAGGVIEGGEGGATGEFVALASGVATQAVVASQAFAMRRGGVDRGATWRGSRADPLDPATRQAAQLGPPLLGPEMVGQRVSAEAPAEVRAHASLEEVLPAIVRRIAWSGDGRKGSLRLEFGAGALAGGTLVVHADEGRVRVELHAPSGTDAAVWRDRIAARLEEKRIRVDELVVES
jgi:hypothetical protein